MAPSQNAYFGPLTARSTPPTAARAAMGDFCELIGDSPEEAIKKLGTSVAGVIGPATEAVASDAAIFRSASLVASARAPRRAEPRGAPRRPPRSRWWCSARAWAPASSYGRGASPSRRRRRPRAGLSAGRRLSPAAGPPRIAHARLAPGSKRSKPAPAALSPLPDRSPLDEGARTQALRAFAEKKAPELRDCVAEPDRGPPLKLGAAFEIGSDGAVDFVQILGADGSPKDVKRATPTA